MMGLKLHHFYILTTIAAFLFVICEGKHSVYNIYTGKYGSYFNASGPGVRSNDERLGDLETAMTKITLKLQNLGSGMTPAKSRVAFMARMSKTDDIRFRKEVKFDDVSLNEGDGYNKIPDSGIFTAPENGYYVFHVTVTAKHRSGVDFNLMVNGIPRLPVFGNPPAADMVVSATNSAVLLLDKNELVYVLAQTPATVTNTSTFSGYLI